jgi:hypothetical protein
VHRAAIRVASASSPATRARTRATRPSGLTKWAPGTQPSTQLSTLNAVLPAC